MSLVTGVQERLGLGVEWDRPRPDAAALRRDLVWGLGLVVLSLPLFEISRSSGTLANGRTSTAEQLVWTVVSVLPLAVRRRWPVAAMAVAALVFLVAGIRDPIVSVQIPVQIALFAALYNGVAWGRDRRATAIVLGVILAVMAGWLVVLFVNARAADGLSLDLPEGRYGVVSVFTAAILINILVNVLYFFGAAAFGQAAWYGAWKTTQLAEQAERLERQQQEIARRAVVDERLRIARELHDVAAHHVSVIGVQAAAARRVLAVDADRAREALSAVESSSRQAVGEMRQLLGVLRHEDHAGPEGPGGEGGAGRTPQPDLHALDALVAEVTAAGLEVELTRAGEPQEVSSTMALSLYRTVQEALTNVQRHSTARTARVVLRFGAADVDAPGEPAWVEVEVLDQGRPRDGSSGSLLGHLGMRERAEVHHGAVEIGPRAVGGFRVRMRLPLEPAPSAAVVGA